MDLHKIKTYMGFARKMGRLSYGQAVFADLDKKGSKLVIIDSGASQNTKEKVVSVCNRAGVKWVELPKGEAADAIGKPNVRVVCIKDGGLIKVITENLD